MIQKDLPEAYPVFSSTTVSAPVTKQSPFNTTMKWGQMTAVQKIVFCGKFVIALSTFGFVFPNLFD